MIFLPYAMAWFKSKGKTLEFVITNGEITSAKITDRYTGKIIAWWLGNWGNATGVLGPRIVP